MMYSFEQALRQVPRYSLITHSSPVRLLTKISDHIQRLNPLSGFVYVKDDGSLNPYYGGNKIRKLEFIFGDALAQQTKELWTIGGLGSHHVLATALHAAPLGIQCRIFHVEQPITHQVLQNLRILSTMPVKLHLMDRTPEIKLGAAIRSQLACWLEAGRTELGQDPYFIPSGGSSYLGTLGYVLAAFELYHEIASGRLPMIDRLYVAVGSGSTLAGLALGIYLTQLPIEVIGVRVVSRTLVNQGVVNRLISASIDFMQRHGFQYGFQGKNHSDVRYRIKSGHVGKGYGYETIQGEMARALALQDHLDLDSIYTAKVMGALVEEASQTSGTSLFWNTKNSRDLSPFIKNAESLEVPFALPKEYHEYFTVLGTSH